MKTIFSCTIACVYVYQSAKMKFLDSYFFLSDIYAKTHKVYFDNQGVPFITLAQKNMDCQHGVDRQLVAKEKRKKYKSNQKEL